MLILGAFESIKHIVFVDGYYEFHIKEQFSLFWQFTNCTLIFSIFLWSTNLAN